MPFSITISRTFCAAHRLKLPDGTFEPNHGHNWHVRVTVARSDQGLDEIGCVIDFHDLERQLDAVIGTWNNSDLNEAEPFARGINPTAERVAEAVATRLDLPKNVVVQRVDVTEADGCEATWTA